MFVLLMILILSKTNFSDMFLGVIILATFGVCMVEHSILPIFYVLGVLAVLFGIYIGIIYLIDWVEDRICSLTRKIVDFFRK